MSWLAHQARDRPQAPALRGGDLTLDYETLAGRVARAAGALAAAGAAPGDRVAVRLPNRLDHAVVVHAVSWLGAVLVPVHARWAPAEAAGPLAQVGARLLIADAGDPIVGAGLPCPVLPAAELEAKGGALPEAAAQPAPQVDGALHSILFTSGTTGAPRPVPLTHGNHRASAEASAANLGVEPDDDWLCCLPLSHVGGLAILLRSALYGTCATLADGFEPAAVAALLAGGRITLASLVPTMLRRVLEVAPPPAPRLRAVLLGGGPIDRGTVERALDRGLPALGTYGMTETASQVATVPTAQARAKAGSGGRALPGVELEVVGAGDRPLPPGETGVIRVRGAMVSAAAAGPGGWLVTGDLGRLDADGFLWVAGRRDELVVTGGENVAPAEVEAVLRAHPEVADCAVVGVPDPEWGHAVAAAIVPRDPARPPAPADLAAWCRARLAGFKVPRRWTVVAELPRTSSGKVVTARVRELV
jgi:O-succinylbenzoic acid--CoA ligase